MIVKHRDEFCRRLESWGIPHAPTEANFVLVRVGARAHEIARRLRQRGVLVRDWSDNPRLGSYLRITIGDASQMRRLAAELTGLRFMIETVNGTPAWQDLTASLPIGWSA
jgi:histidinol-phosphate/aromatic aminotransferase/cobyric acid decarboxylase-like protein